MNGEERERGGRQTRRGGGGGGEGGEWGRERGSEEESYLTGKTCSVFLF